MAWTTVPVTAASSVLKAQFDEVKAAINERQTACGLTLTTDAATANGAQLRSLLTTYRTAIDTLIPYFANSADSTYAAYTKATCLTAALGAGRTDWLGVQAPAYMFVDELNELRLVLNKLEWVGYDPTWATSASYWSWPGGGSSDVSWADAWGAAQTAYAAAAPVAISVIGFWTSAYSPSPPDAKTYYKDINRSEAADITVAIPDIAVADTKLRVQKYGGGDNGTIDLHEQASYGGAATAISVTAAQNEYVAMDVTTVTRNTTAHYSLRNNPAAPDPTSYVPADANASTHGWQLYIWKLLVKFTFSYVT